MFDHVLIEDVVKLLHELLDMFGLDVLVIGTLVLKEHSDEKAMGRALVDKEIVRKTAALFARKRDDLKKLALELLFIASSSVDRFDDVDLVHKSSLVSMLIAKFG